MRQKARHMPFYELLWGFTAIYCLFLVFSALYFSWERARHEENITRELKRVKLINENLRQTIVQAEASWHGLGYKNVGGNKSDKNNRTENNEVSAKKSFFYRSLQKIFPSFQSIYEPFLVDGKMKPFCEKVNKNLSGGCICSLFKNDSANVLIEVKANGIFNTIIRKPDNINSFNYTKSGLKTRVNLEVLRFPNGLVTFIYSSLDLESLKNNIHIYNVDDMPEHVDSHSEMSEYFMEQRLKFEEEQREREKDLMREENGKKSNRQKRVSTPQSITPASSRWDNGSVRQSPVPTQLQEQEGNETLAQPPPPPPKDYE